MTRNDAGKRRQLYVEAVEREVVAAKAGGYTLERAIAELTIISLAPTLATEIWNRNE